jgi:NitT/TauT family transport system ATP-binding protein
MSVALRDPDCKVRITALTVDVARVGAPPLRVLDNVSLNLAAGEFVSIVGPSGCGKSTLLRVLAGLARPSSGQVRIDDIPVEGTPAGVGLMFQRDTLMPWASVAENIAIAAELRGASRAAIQQTVTDLISFLRLAGFEAHLPHQLSGGMRQRVALGRLLAYEPELYLMDEPFGALDAQTKVLMGRELLRIWSTHRRSVVFVTHDVEEAVALSDRVIVLSGRPGRVRLDVTVDLERPRDVRSLRATPRFRDLCNDIWSSLEIEAI